MSVMCYVAGFLTACTVYKSIHLPLKMIPSIQLLRRISPDTRHESVSFFEHSFIVTRLVAWVSKLTRLLAHSLAPSLYDIRAPIWLFFLNWTALEIHFLN